MRFLFRVLLNFKSLVGRMDINLPGTLLQTPTPPPAASPESFWQANRDAILLAVITALITVFITLFISDPLKGLLRKIWEKLERGLESLGFRYKKRYLRHLVDEHQWLELIGQRRGLERPRLEDVYISLQLRSATAEEAQRFDWRRLFDGDDKKLVILGHPGAGKSTLQKYLALVFAGHAGKDAALAKQLKQPVPLFVRLRAVGVGEEKPSLMDLLTAPIEKTPKGYFERLLSNSDCIVLLDGLDEVLDRKLHNRVVDEIQTLVRDYPDNWYVITCRIAGWREQLPGFRVYSILEFGPDDIRRFASAWYREVLRIQAVNALGPVPKQEKRQEVEKKAFQVAQVRAKNLWQALQNNPGLLQIASTPLILSLIALVHNDRETQLPKGRARLYARCLDILLEEWDLQDKQLEFGEDHPSPQDKLLALKHVAFHFLRDEILQMERGELVELVREPVSRFSTQMTPEKFIATIHERSGILVEVAHRRFGFAHRALQDYSNSRTESHYQGKRDKAEEK